MLVPTTVRRRNCHDCVGHDADEQNWQAIANQRHGPRRCEPSMADQANGQDGSEEPACAHRRVEGAHAGCAQRERRHRQHDQQHRQHAVDRALHQEPSGDRPRIRQSRERAQALGGARQKPGNPARRVPGERRHDAPDVDPGDGQYREDGGGGRCQRDQRRPAIHQYCRAKCWAREGSKGLRRACRHVRRASSLGVRASAGSNAAWIGRTTWPRTSTAAASK